jgi:hypothetical protein
MEMRENMEVWMTNGGDREFEWRMGLEWRRGFKWRQRCHHLSHTQRQEYQGEFRERTLPIYGPSHIYPYVGIDE